MVTKSQVTPFPPLPSKDLRTVFLKNRDLWRKFRGKRIFVAGCTGFVGSWLLEAFAYCNRELGLGATLVGLSRDPKSFLRHTPHLRQEASIQFHQGDVVDFTFPSGRFDFLIHAAASAEKPTTPEETVAVMIAGTRRLLDFASHAGVKRFLYVSSGAVYGNPALRGFRIPEEYAGAPDPTDPASAYGEGKRIAELLCSLSAQSHKMQVRIARCFAFIGPKFPLNSKYAAGNFMRDALAGKAILIKDGRPRRTYLYAADLTAALYRILLVNLKETVIAVNVGGASAVSISQLARLIRRVIAPKTKIKVVKRSIRVNPRDYLPRVNRLRDQFGFRPAISLPSAIERTASWHRKICG